jgi:hypothetical protein
LRSWEGYDLKKRILVTLAIPLLLLLAFGLTYIPHNVVNIEPSKVSKITVFDGNTGYELEIKDESDINYIINNLNNITFQKGKLTFGYMGYSYKTTIYNHKGKAIKELIINSNDTIRYKGFFYISKNHSIDFNYIKQLLVQAHY